MSATISTSIGLGNGLGKYYRASQVAVSILRFFTKWLAGLPSANAKDTGLCVARPQPDHLVPIVTGGRYDNGSDVDCGVDRHEALTVRKSRGGSVS